MSLIMIRDVVKYSPSKGNARLVEFVMAEAVNEERVRLGSSPAVWLSQNTIARRCNCSRSTVERGLDVLKELRRAFDTGERMNGRFRGTVVYHLADPHLDDPWVLTGTGSPDLTDPGSGDLTDPDVTQNGSGGDDLTRSAPGLTHSRDDLTHFEDPPASTLTHKPGVKPGPKPEDLTDARAGAREGDLPPDSESFLSPYSSGSSRPPAHEAAEALEDAREILRERTDAFDQAEVGTPEKLEAFRLKTEQEAIVAQLEGRPQADAA